MTGLRLLSIGFVLFLLGAEVIAAVRVAAKIDRQYLTLEDQALLTITIEGVRNPGQPELPENEAFEISYQGSSSKMQIVNGTITVGTDFTYMVTPQKEGNFVIGPVKLTLNDKVVQSNTVAIHVGAAQEEAPQEKDLFISVGVDRDRPYVGEMIILTFSFYRRISLSDASLEKPTLENLLVEPLEKEREYDKVINGREYKVYEFKEALFAMRPGPLTIPSYVLKMKVRIDDRRGRSPFSGFFDDSFFGGRTTAKIIRSKPIELDILALPEEEKPKGFQGLVGQFRMSADISKERIKLGDSVTLTYRISGFGNLKNFTTLSPGELGDFKTYDDKPELSVRANPDGLHMERTIKKALVPLRHGIFTIPAVTLAYFNPDKQRYEFVTTNSFQLTVDPSRDNERLNAVESTNLIVGKEQVKILGKDILGIHTDLDKFSTKDDPLKSPLYYAGLFFPPSAFALFVLMKRRRRFKEANLHLHRRGNAEKTFLRAMSGLQKQGSEIDDRDFADSVLRAVRRYFGDKCAIEGASLTPVELERILDRHVDDKSRLNDFISRLEVLEFLQFATGQKLQAPKDDTVKFLLAFINFIDRKMS